MRDDNPHDEGYEERDNARRAPRNRDDDLDSGRRSRRKSRSDFDDREPRIRNPSVFGIIALLFGVGGLLLSLIPCIGMFGLIPAGIGLLLGIISIILAKSSAGEIGMGIPVSATVISLLGIVAALFWLGLFAMFKRASEQVSVEVDSDQIIAIAAIDLDTEYDKNDAAADAKYKGKILDVSGTVIRVTRDVHPGKYTVELLGMPDSGSTVDCIFALDKKSELAAIAEGDLVTVRGKCVGKLKVDRTLWVSLEKCSSIAKGLPKDPKKGATALVGRVKNIELEPKGGTLTLVVDGQVRKLKLTDVTRFIDKNGQRIKEDAGERLNKEDVTVLLEKLDGEDVVKDVIQKQYELPAGERIEGRVKSVSFGPKGGTLILAVKGMEKKLKLTEDSRFFDSEGDQIHEKIGDELTKEDVIVIVGKVNNEDVVKDVKQKQP